MKISGLRAVLIVGDVDGDSGRTTLQYIKNLKDVATLLRSRGVAVKEFYSPDNSWEKIRSAADGANFVIYSGHGVGSNLDKPPYKQSTVGGFALKNKFVSNEDVASTLHPAKGAIVIFLGACFTAGNMAYDMGVIGDEEAISRISMYSKPFLNAGFGGYYATWAPWTAQGVIARLFGSENFGSSYLDEADISGVKKLSHPQDSSSALWYQKAKQNGQTVYNYAFVGYPDKDLTSLFGDEKTESKKTDENKSPEISEAEKLNLNQNLLYSIYTKNAKDAAEYLKKGADPNSE
ncbi:MAG: ankyrin repeat domain-containing protein, partial [Leptospira sp.]|nr:ankyrin repeat domain-containing protein [Leptospira sp.]